MSPSDCFAILLVALSIISLAYLTVHVSKAMGMHFCQVYLCNLHYVIGLGHLTVHVSKAVGILFFSVDMALVSNLSI